MNAHPTGTYLSSYEHRQKMTDAIFKRKKEEEPEPFSSRKSITVDTQAEQKVDWGLFAITCATAVEQRTLSEDGIIARPFDEQCVFSCCAI